MALNFIHLAHTDAEANDTGIPALTERNTCSLKCGRYSNNEQEHKQYIE